MKHWELWTDVLPGACQFLGTAPGRTFPEACLTRALADRGFADLFDPSRLTFEGRTLFSSPFAAVQGHEALPILFTAAVTKPRWLC